jgi:transposase-like protein
MKKTIRVCPNPSCQENQKLTPKKTPVYRNSSYKRASDSRTIRRFLCSWCRKTFSDATLDPAFGQKKRHLNREILWLLVSHVSNNRIALILKVKEEMIANRLEFFSKLAEEDLKKMVNEYLKNPVTEFQFDEMESFEHTKLKQVSIPIVVDQKSRKILGIDVCIKPTSGNNASLARKKYGPRPDERSKTLRNLLQNIKPALSENAHGVSDQKSTYPNIFESVFKTQTHSSIKGDSGCITGQGELKKTKFDPIFSLNHTCAMVRYGLATMGRKTWCTTKKLERLKMRLTLYAVFHNRVLIEKKPIELVFSTL